MPYLHLPCRRGREAEANPTQTQTTELDTGDMEKEVLAWLTALKEFQEVNITKDSGTSMESCEEAIAKKKGFYVPFSWCSQCDSFLLQGLMGSGLPGQLSTD